VANLSAGGSSTMNGEGQYHKFQESILILRRICALHGRIFALKQDASHIHYKVTWREKNPGLISPPAPYSSYSAIDKDDSEALLRHYFSLDLNLGSLYEQWAKADPNFRRRATQFTGVRILSQDAWEALIGFICSSNNNITRISQMVSHFA
jgi:N-glycosylase/DNA lyase